MSQIPVWALIVISISGSFITGAFLVTLYWLNKRTELLKATDNFRFEIFKKKLNVYQKLNILISNIFILSASKDVQVAKNIELTKARLQLQEFISSNSMMISSEIGTLLLTLLQQKQDTGLTAKTINFITERMDKELCLGKTHKINESSISSLKDKYKTT